MRHRKHNRVGGTLASIALYVLSAFALAAPKVDTMTVRYPSGMDTIQAFLCVPQSKGVHPAIVVIHEWWGLNDWVKQNAQALASMGYITVAVDLYRGKSTALPDVAHELSRGLPDDRATRDLIGAVQYLKSRPDVDRSRIGSIGWCSGGGYSLTAALNVSDLAACAICYGRLVTDSMSIKKIPCPILGIFGEDDQGITPEDVRKFESQCKAAGKAIDVHIYPKSGHAFMNPNNKKGYNKAAAKDAWSKIYGFFFRTLERMHTETPGKQ